jgi:CheY-like chemotaxis protein
MASQAHQFRAPARALLVIDQVVLADVVKLALHHGQYSISVARTHEEAVTTLAAWHPHLLVLDMEAAGNAFHGVRWPNRSAADSSGRRA